MLLKQVLVQSIWLTLLLYLRRKLQDEVKHNSEASQESDMEQEDSNNHLTDDDQ